MLYQTVMKILISGWFIIFSTLRYVEAMFNPIVKILGVIALALATAVNAEEKDPFDITIYGSFLHTGTVPNALFFFNDIEQYDSFELRRAIRNHDIITED